MRLRAAAQLAAACLAVRGAGAQRCVDCFNEYFRKPAPQASTPGAP